jgi:hypothetical protein
MRTENYYLPFRYDRLCIFGNKASILNDCLTNDNKLIVFSGRTIRSVYGRVRLLYGTYYGRNIGHRNTTLS